MKEHFHKFCKKIRSFNKLKEKFEKIYKNIYPKIQDKNRKFFLKNKTKLGKLKFE